MRTRSPPAPPRPARSGFALAGLLIVALVAALGGRAPAQSGSGSPQPLPLGYAPIPGLDADTFAWLPCDSDLKLVLPSGPGLVKSTNALAPGQGIFGTGALRVGTHGVGIYPSRKLPADRGTVELWVAATPLPAGQSAVLFATRPVASLDGDARSDLVVGEATSGTAPAQSRIHFDGGSGVSPSLVASFSTVVPRGIGCGDVDGDGDVDLVVAMNQAGGGPVPGLVVVYLGPFAPGQPLVPAQLIPVDRPQGLLLAEFDAHPGPDLLVASYDDQVAPIFGFRNDGAGHFTPMDLGLGALKATAEGLAAADVDKDGVLDVLYGSLDTHPSAVLHGHLTPAGDYVFDLVSGAFPRSSGVLGVSFGDIDADGWPDAALASPAGGIGHGEVALYRNDGAGAFGAAADCSFPTVRPFTLAAGRDLNNDGYLDIAVANWREGPPSAPPTPDSTVHYGPFLDHGQCLAPPSRNFPVLDAVSLAVGDLNGDGLDDLFFHASKGTASPVYYLDANGAPLAGTGSQGEALASLVLATQPTQANPAGEGSGVACSATGTTAYGGAPFAPNALELELRNGLLRFRVTDSSGRAHVASAPFPPVADPAGLGPFHHVQAEWDAAAGVVELRVGHPGFRASIFPATNTGPFKLDALSPVFHLGSDADNQRPAAGFLLDDLRLSTVRRSQLDADGDGVPDEWDVCKGLANPSQADSDHDGVGDACATCQPDLGFGGGGQATLSVCGAPLVPGTPALVLLDKAAPNSNALFFVGLAALPTPWKGETFVPAGLVFQVTLPTDAAGQSQVFFSAPGPAGSVVLQAVVVDPSQPAGYDFSNAVAIELLP